MAPTVAPAMELSDRWKALDLVGALVRKVGEIVIVARGRLEEVEVDFGRKTAQRSGMSMSRRPTFRQWYKKLSRSSGCS